MRLRTIGLILIFALVLLIGPLSVVAQQSSKKVTVGLFSTGDPKNTARHDAFIQELRTRGWVEGHSLIIESRFAQGQHERLPTMAAELVRLRVNVIATFGSGAILAAKSATTTIPIVFETLSDAVAMGFVTNLVHPGGNITGVTGFASELGGKWLQLLREVVPGANPIGLVTNATNPNTPKIVSITADAARSLDVRLSVVEAHPTPLESAFATLAQMSADALIVPPDPLFAAQRKRITALALKHRLPTISGIQPVVSAGGLMSYGTSLEDNWRRAAVYVDRILRGAKPSDLPVERPTTFELVINLKTAKALGITMPSSILYRANKVIR